ncbi:MAG: relaxase/mobilization nuclease domain-containing protein [Aquabacterium commune]
MLTDDPEKALKVMAWTAKHSSELKATSGQKMTGRKAEHPVYNYALAWAPDQSPNRSEMTAFGLKSLEVLGLSEHEALFVAHNDTDHTHLHVIANRVHPVTGLMAKMSKDQLHLSRLAQSYEEGVGRIDCHQRVVNNQKRDRGQWTKADPEERLGATVAYRQRRAARIEAQRRAGALAEQRRRIEQIRQDIACSVRTDFDRASARDDCRESPRLVQRQVLGLTEEHARERVAARRARKEEDRRTLIDAKRAERWRHYEAERWQSLNDKQTERCEGLHEIQADARTRLEHRLTEKYACAEAAIERRTSVLRCGLGTRGLRGVVDRAIGKHATFARQLLLQKHARTNLEAQKEREREALRMRQATQREAQRQRQEAERQRLAKRLCDVKDRQDTAFEEREQARATKLAGEARLVHEQAKDKVAGGQRRVACAQGTAVATEGRSRGDGRTDAAHSADRALLASAIKREQTAKVATARATVARSAEHKVKAKGPEPGD